MDILLNVVIVLFLGYVYYLGQIAIHNGVHYILFKKKKLKRIPTAPANSPNCA